MNLGVLIIGIVMILLFVVPIILMNRKRHKED
jgi:hypothetical protein